MLDLRELVRRTLTSHAYDEEAQACDCGEKFTPKEVSTLGTRWEEHVSNAVVEQLCAHFGPSPCGKEVTLAETGTPLARFHKERTDAISEMFNSADQSGAPIYPTTKFFARLDTCFQLEIAEAERRAAAVALEQATLAILNFKPPTKPSPTLEELLEILKEPVHDGSISCGPPQIVQDCVAVIRALGPERYIERERLLAAIEEHKETCLSRNVPNGAYPNCYYDMNTQTGERTFHGCSRYNALRDAASKLGGGK